MVKNLLKKSALLLLAMLVGGGVTVSAADKWVLTAPADLATGDVVVIVDQTSSKAMSNNNGTKSAPSATAVTLNAEKSEISSTVADNNQWIVTVIGTQNLKYKFGVSGTSDYLYTTDANNGLRVGSNTNNEFYISEQDGKYYLAIDYTNTSSKKVTRYVGVYSSQDWRGYTSIGTNISETVTALYKKTTVTDKTPAGLSFDETEFTCDLGKTFSAPTLNKETDADESYTSSNTAVATVDAESGSVTLIGVGTTTITAQTDETETYASGSASYTLTVTSNEGQSIVTPNPTTSSFVKVTSTEDITSGKYLIVYEDGNVAFDGSLGTLDAANNVISVAISEDQIEASTSALASAFDIDVTAGTIKSASGKYIGVSSNSNGLKQSDDASTYTHTFSIDDSGNAVVSAAFEGSTMKLRYNSASDQNRFRYYKSGQQAIQLYKLAEAKPNTVALSSYGYKTLVASENFTVTGATAYIVTAATSVGVTTRSLNVVPKNTPVFLKGDASATATATLNFDADATPDDVEDNKLAISEAGQSYNDHYVLASKSGSVGFYKWNGGTLGAGRVYLPKNYVTDAAARTFLPFDFDEATGISSMQNSQSTMPNEVYDLQGRRVAQPAKGLYIVNGKKVLVK